jgi:hypothetical protein
MQPSPGFPRRIGDRRILQVVGVSKILSLTLVLSALSVLGCQLDATRVAELETPETVAPSVAEPESGEATEEAIEVADGEEIVQSSSGGTGEDPFGSFGLLGPIVPGFSPDLVSSSCNPLEDPYATCL